MNITKYYCDKCKDETDREKLKALSVCEKSYSYGYNFKPLLEFELCPACREKLGLIQKVIKDEQIVEQPAPNVKDMLFDAMSKMIAELGLSKEY